HFFRHAEAKDGLAGEAITRLVGAQKLTSLLFRGEESAPHIAPGERADLTVLTWDPMTPMTASNLFGHVIFGWSSACVRDRIAGHRAEDDSNPGSAEYPAPLHRRSEHRLQRRVVARADAGRVAHRVCRRVVSDPRRGRSPGHAGAGPGDPARSVGRLFARGDP